MCQLFQQPNRLIALSRLTKRLGFAVLVVQVVFQLVVQVIIALLQLVVQVIIAHSGQFIVQGQQLMYR